VTDHIAENSRGRSPTVVRIFLCLAIITLGLSLRRYGFSVGLPSLIVKYGGSILWATMVFFLVALVLPILSRFQIAAIAALIAIAVELFRLIHTPWLDAFRLTLAGALLLGRIFSLWNILAYAVGILLGVLLDAINESHSPSRGG
jgi:Protein of unknown function (DUF2809)